MTNRKIFHRRSVRLRGYDYSQPGAYFITVCAHDRLSLFGHIRELNMHLTELGVIVREEWLRTPALRPGVQLDEFGVMPNHFHGILMLDDNYECRSCVHSSPAFGKPVSGSVSVIVGAFKGAATARTRSLCGDPKLTIWQPGFYEHVIENEKDLERIREYILENPQRWQSDKENPESIHQDEFDRWLRRGRRKPRK
jgi:putative transposase